MFSVYKLLDLLQSLHVTAGGLPCLFVVSHVTAPPLLEKESESPFYTRNVTDEMPEKE